jgi:hypothetical protein
VCNFSVGTLKKGIEKVCNFSVGTLKKGIEKEYEFFYRY